MDVLTAVATLRELDSLSEARRHYLSKLAATAPTDADRARIVTMAKRENVNQRWATEQALKAELDDRRAWATKNPENPVEVPQAASQRIVRTDDTTPEHRPVTVRFVAPTKTAKAKPVRAEGMGTNRVYDKTPEPEQPMKHGITGYNQHGCRCELCRAAKAESRKRRGLRRPNGDIPPHGTISRYSNMKCRYDGCRSAAAEYARQWRARRPKDKGADAQ